MLVSGTNEVIDVTRPSVVALEVELIGMRACFKAPHSLLSMLQVQISLQRSRLSLELWLC